MQIGSNGNFAHCHPKTTSKLNPKTMRGLKSVSMLVKAGDQGKGQRFGSRARSIGNGLFL